MNQIRLDGDWILGKNVNIYCGPREDIYYFTLPSGERVVIDDSENAKASLYRDKIKQKELTVDETSLLKRIEDIVIRINRSRKAESMLEYL